MRRSWWVGAMVLVATSCPWPQQVAPAVTTRAYDNARSGTNAREVVLTQAAVLARGMVRQTTIPVSGDARGMEAWPLVLPGVTMADGSAHDVMVLPSMANVVRGVDAETGAGLWSTTLGTPITGSAQIDFHSINQHWGCLSTGVLDADTQRLYQVCWVSQDGSGSPASGRYMMFGYPIRTANLGGTTKATVGTAANYAKLAAPCAWLTVSPGPVPCAPANPTALNFFPWGDTAHLHMTPVQMYDPLLKAWVIFVWGENGQLHKWAVGAGSTGTQPGR